ncbi:hypothetical protein DDZ18_00280 [Marinicauda salina]|uniref:Uncharacterized protein n=2 Tax=Marinicauda salina TaxID=2135793 RepID=A0A2U2BVR8_9PROT|nr:hypothetical protein DDZ18_00280 [Marinicauda salina]
MLQAYGKPWLPERSDSCEPVPGSLFDPDAEIPPTIDWQASFIEARGRAYDAVRVISPDELAALTGSKPRRRGPISYRDEIEQIVRELMATDRHWLRKPFSQRRREVIAKAAQRFSYIDKGDTRGFGRTTIDDVVKKVIVEKQ